MSVPSPRRGLSFRTARLLLCLLLGLLIPAQAGCWDSGSPPSPADEPHPTEASEPVVATALPGGFVIETVVSGLIYPTAFARLPDGRILITEKSGLVRLFKNGVLQNTPFIDLRNRVNTHQDRGLLSIAIDPDFAANGFIYLLYTYDDDATDDTGPKTGRLARYTAVGDSASLSSEFVLLGTVVGSTCKVFPAGTDCIPSDSASHSVGDVKFAPDGTLFVTTGEGAQFDKVDDDALRAQDLDSLAGKVLHITRTGQGVPGNPFWNGNAAANRSKVWAYGLRNPYRFNLRPDNGVPYLGDVGWTTYEEVNAATAGANLGWPCYEGPFRQPGYESKTVCQALYARGTAAVRMPLHYWDHTVGSAATGGFFYTGTVYPSSWKGAYFFGDYSRSWISALRADANNNLVPGSVTSFASGIGALVDLEQGPDELLYYIEIHLGQLRRLRYTAGNTPPTAVASAAPREGYPPLLVRFSSAGSQDPDGDVLQYAWDFGDGTPVSNVANPEHTYQAPGSFTARLTVSDGRGGSHSTTVPISIGNRAPVPTIASPSGSFLFKVGDVINYSGSAIDPESGAIPASQLSWTITLYHCSGTNCHSHPFITNTGAGGSFSVTDHGDEIYFGITLTATDSSGLTGSTSVTIRPQTVLITLQTSPPGLQVVFDGASGPAPLTSKAIVGSSHTIIAPSPQGNQTFATWSDGGAREHTILAGTANATYTATFVPITTDSCPVGQYRAEYFNNQYLMPPAALVRCETAPIFYDWGTGSPSPLIKSNYFSVRWTGRFNFAAGTYTFIARANDGVRVYVDGTRIIDAWIYQSTTTYQATRTLTAGEHQVVMEYNELTGNAVAQLRW
ncbi:PQQ-dependent sugar dehydrogenase [Archangium gephyra]|uniref:PQQ-dependent sugar dehydrogenase n=1 Tax=Archangium gephyra TaxID=48 RepID=UPI0035D44E83